MASNYLNILDLHWRGGKRIERKMSIQPAFRFERNLCPKLGYMCMRSKRFQVESRSKSLCVLTNGPEFKTLGLYCHMSIF